MPASFASDRGATVPHTRLKYEQFPLLVTTPTAKAGGLLQLHLASQR